MSSDEWQKVKTVLEACLERPVHERRAFLASSCPEGSVRAEVSSLLDAHSDPENDFLEDPVVPSFGPPIEVLGPGTLLSHYRLDKEIGRGGMGVVYRAYRADDEFSKVAAIKVLSRAVLNDGMRRRFLRERQLLASLDHPYIARLLDGGTTTDGTPYLVMEYVEGVRLTEHCDRARLTVAERLRLFRKVCEAVSFAHQNLVVHRDIKPGNILVAADGTPKLLDFGIAKILNDRIVPVADPTATMMLAATPAYASPEQVRGNAVRVTTDVYSLGMILYELLSGCRPYQLPREDALEAARIVCEEVPPLMSVAVAGQDVAPDVFHQRGTTPAALRRALRGDLDTIVATALRKEPQRRYASVEQLSEDVRRHLDGRPLKARRDSWRYRSAKFLQRNRVGVALGALASLLLCGTTAVAVQQAHRLERRVAADRALAGSFLAELHDAIAKLPGSTPARETLLKKSLEYLNGLAADTGDDLAADPEMARQLARAYERFADL